MVIVSYCSPDRNCPTPSCAHHGQRRTGASSNDVAGAAAITSKAD